MAKSAPWIWTATKSAVTGEEQDIGQRLINKAEVVQDM